MESMDRAIFGLVFLAYGAVRIFISDRAQQRWGGWASCRGGAVIWSTMAAVCFCSFLLMGRLIEIGLGTMLISIAVLSSCRSLSQSQDDCGDKVVSLIFLGAAVLISWPLVLGSGPGGQIIRMILGILLFATGGWFLSHQPKEGDDSGTDKKIFGCLGILFGTILILRAWPSFGGLMLALGLAWLVGVIFNRIESAGSDSSDGSYGSSLGAEPWFPSLPPAD